MKSKALTCKLTTPELQRRKATILADLRTAVLEKKTLKNGFKYRFDGSDEMVDQITSFIKAERQCCDFFDFDVSIAGDGGRIWMTISGPKGVKEFIESELGL